MVLSAERRSSHDQLSDTQLVILSAAAQRDDSRSCRCPRPQAQGRCLNKVLGSLKARGLIDHHGARAATTRRRWSSPAPASRPSASSPRTTAGARHAEAARARRRPRPESRRPRPRPGDRGRRRRHAGQEQGQGEGKAKPGTCCAGRQAHPARRHQAGPHDRDAQAPRGRHRRADRRGHRLAAPHHPRRDLRRAQEETRAHRRGDPHPRGRPQQDRRQGQHHRLPDHRVEPAPAERPLSAGMHDPRSSARAIGSTRLDSPEAEALLAEQGLSPRRPRPCPRWAGAQRGHTVRTIVGINEDGVFGTTPRGLAPGPARRLPRALHPAALAQGPGAARPRARGQHGPVCQGRHAAGLIAQARPRLPLAS